MSISLHVRRPCKWPHSVSFAMQAVRIVQGSGKIEVDDESVVHEIVPLNLIQKDSTPFSITLLTAINPNFFAKSAVSFNSASLSLHLP